MNQSINLCLTYSRPTQREEVSGVYSMITAGDNQYGWYEVVGMVKKTGIYYSLGMVSPEV